MRQNAYKTFPLTVAAGETAVINASGTFINCLASDQDDFLMALDDGNPEFFAEGISIELSPGDAGFQKISVTNPNGSSLTVRLGLGYGRVNDSRKTITITGGVDSNIVTPTGLVTTSDVSVSTASATQVLASNADRKKAYVFNPAAAGGSIIRVGDSNVGASRGARVPPQQGIELETTAAIYVYQASGSSMSIAVMETEA